MLKCQRDMKIKNAGFPFQCTGSPIVSTKYLDAQHSDLKDKGKSTENLIFNAGYIF